MGQNGAARSQNELSMKLGFHSRHITLSDAVYQVQCLYLCCLCRCSQVNMSDFLVSF
ncbi:hypothetical protein EG68_12152 [Paragonimus skrjabini miyazakii]|uniref:Uncharacterized protein n=1 Tax=Paragonimus skrjabini miyazakii TaxID=59628 RepID=A0A8S9YNV1_9TREM|nr:hypothetical protein EG68_12152 [Paragonimus skrjabini miyazakii]